MKKIMLVGTVGCGKTTLARRLHGLDLSYKKTQAIELINNTIDTPGEYLEFRNFFHSLLVTSVEVDLVVFLFDASQEKFMYSPGQSSAFSVPVIGVVTKTDIASEQQLKDARELLELAGAEKIFEVSSLTGKGVDELLSFLAD